MSRFAVFLLALGLAVLSGCGRKNAPIPAPTYDTDGMVEAAMAEFDADKDGKLSQKELTACPGLKRTFDGKPAVTAADLKERFENYKAGSAGAVGVAVVVTLDKQPLAGAALTFVPEACMRGAVRGATAVTDDVGRATAFDVSGEALPGLPPGLYKVKVEAAGKAIPDRYAGQTTLGLEAGGSKLNKGVAVRFDLTSR